jgi:hypothetical protein
MSLSRRVSRQRSSTPESLGRRVSVLLTNWLWIPVILHYDLAVRRLLKGVAIARATA